MDADIRAGRVKYASPEKQKEAEEQARQNNSEGEEETPQDKATRIAREAKAKRDKEKQEMKFAE